MFIRRILTLLALLLALSLGAAACGADPGPGDPVAAGSGEQAAQSPLPTRTTSTEPTVDPVVVQAPAAFDGSSCDVLVTFAETVAAFNQTDVLDADVMRVAAEAVFDGMRAVVADPASPEVAAEMVAVLDAWGPWIELLDAHDYDLFAVDPDEMEALLAAHPLLADPAAFEQSSDRILGHAVDVCGLDPAVVAVIDGDEPAIDGEAFDADTGGVTQSADGGFEYDLLDDSLAGNDAVLVFDFEGDRYEMTEGFCDHSVAGQVVGAFTDGTIEASFTGDVTGTAPGFNAFTVAGNGSASAAQVTWDFIDQSDGLHATFTSNRFAGELWCS